jgi:hypothetical protein
MILNEKAELPFFIVFFAMFSICTNTQSGFGEGQVTSPGKGYN